MSRRAFANSGVHSRHGYWGPLWAFDLVGLEQVDQAARCARCALSDLGIAPTPIEKVAFSYLHRPHGRAVRPRARLSLRCHATVQSSNPTRRRRSAYKSTSAAGLPAVFSVGAASIAVPAAWLRHCWWRLETMAVFRHLRDPRRSSRAHAGWVASVPPPARAFHRADPASGRVSSTRGWPACRARSCARVATWATGRATSQQRAPGGWRWPHLSGARDHH